MRAVAERLLLTTALTPVQYTATESETLYFCGCKQSGSKPLCDGTHTKL